MQVRLGFSIALMFHTLDIYIVLRSLPSLSCSEEDPSKGVETSMKTFVVCWRSERFGNRVANLDRQLEIEKVKLVMSVNDKRDDFPIKVQNYPHLDSNVSWMPMYRVYISQLFHFVPT